jgi:CRISPR-associated protein Cas1
MKWDTVIEKKANELGRFLAMRSLRVDFVEPTPLILRHDNHELRARILGLTPAEATKLGIGKSTLHYLRRNAKKNQFRIYKRVRTKLNTCKGRKPIG